MNVLRMIMQSLREDWWFWLGANLAQFLVLIGGISGTLPQATAGAVSILYCFVYLDGQAMKRRFARQDAARDAYHRLTGDWLPR